MIRRRRRPRIPGDLKAEWSGFVRTVQRLEAAKRTLVAAAPTGRPPALTPGEALAGFEAGLAEARRVMPSWRSERTEAPWERCQAALEQTTRRAERFRLHGSPREPADLVEAFDVLLEPLEAFEHAARWFRRAGHADPPSSGK